MKSSITKFLTIITGALALQASTIGAAESAHKLSDWKIGKVLFGEKINKSDFDGKVVVIENWGVHCPPCIASLPHLAKLEKDNRDKGLVIIGAESQGSSKAQIEPLIKKAGVEYTMTEGANGPIPVSGIPRAFVFDREGKLVFDGHPAVGDFEKSIKKALKEKGTASATSKPAASSDPLIVSRTWKNTDGKEIVAAVKEATETQVTFLMSGGKQVVYPMEKLDEDSQAAIKKVLDAGKLTEEE